MKRLLVLAVLAVAGWQAWKHYPTLLERPLHHEIVIENRCSVALVRVRLKLGDRTEVRERIEPGASAALRLPAGPRLPFRMVWERSDRTLESSWTGPQSAPSPQHYTIIVPEIGRVSIETRDP